MDPGIRAETLERYDELALRRVTGEIDLVDRDVELLPACREPSLVRVRRRVDPNGNRGESRRNSACM